MSLTLQSLNNTKELEQFSPRPFVAFKEKVRKMSIGNIDIIVNKKTIFAGFCCDVEEFFIYLIE